MSSAVELLAEGEAHRLAGRPQLAEQTFRRALQVDAANPTLHHQLGLVLGMQGKLDESLVHLQTAVERNPGNAQWLNNLAVTLRLLGRLDEAVAACRRALSADPNYAQAYHNLSVVLEGLGRFDEAVACGRRAVELNPDSVEARNSLGVALRGQRKFAEAADCFREVVRQRPEFAEAHSNLAGVLGELGQLEQALASAELALDLSAESTRSLVNLGDLLRKSGRPNEALDVVRRASALAPNHAHIHVTLGVVHETRGDLSAAMAAYRRAIELDPNCPEAHMNYGLGLLREGHCEAGWQEYEWRNKVEGVASTNIRQPRWSGESIAGKTILLAEEQGLGDTLQFIRYAEPIKRQGARVLLRVRPELESLLKSCPGVDAAIPVQGALPPFDVYLPLPSAPHAFQTSLETIPSSIPYLAADPALIETWRKKLGPPRDFRVGITWRGSPRHKSDRYRSIPLTKFVPLANIPGVRLFSLQMGAGREELTQQEVPCPIVDLADGIRDFHDTAAILKNLDLLIACDTSVVHLAGALGVPVWVAVALVPDWRWLLGRSDSPWYPTLRIYRQTAWSDWDTVFQPIQHDLAELAVAARPQESIE